MKTTQFATTAALLIAIGGAMPVFGQGRGNWQNGDRGNGAQERRGGGREFRQRDAQPQFQQQQPGNAQRQNYSQPQYQPRNEYRGGRQEFRQPDSQPRFQQSPQRNWQRQNFSQPQYQPSYNYRDRGSSYGGLRWTDRGGYRGRYIPQVSYNSHFGPRHYFRIGRPLYYNGFARFSYGGYGFQLIDPVPAYWGPDWYDSDDVYVDYEDDGYYLYNRAYPGAGIALDIEF